MGNPNNNILTLGGSLILTNPFFNDVGNPYDPPDVQVTIIRSLTTVVAGPFTYASGDVIKVHTGLYQFTYTPPISIVPGLYTAKWEGTVQGDPIVNYFNFQILDALPELATTLDAPQTVGIVRISSLYQNMGFGTTDRLFLVGHTSGLNINDPYQVVNMQEAVNILGADSMSPMVRALMEAYNNGARDIWLVAAAPITEYVNFDVNDEENRFIPRAEWGGLNFYERYAQRLETTYTQLEQWDTPEIICPIEAPFYDTRGVDFLTPLVDHCSNAFSGIGNTRIGIIGTRIVNRTDADIDAMVNDSRLDNLGDGGKFVMVVAGEGTFALPQMQNVHMSSLNVAAATALATNLPHLGLTNRLLPNVVSIVGQNYTKDQIKALSNARINPVIRTQRGKRGIPFQTIVACDNTLSQDGSDYWSLAIVHIVGKVIDRIKNLGNRYLGTIAFGSFQQDVHRYLDDMVKQGFLRGYNLNIVRDADEFNKVLVDVSLRPYTTVREILFTVEVGKAA